MSESTKNNPLEDTIESLTGRLQPVSVCAHPYVCIVPYLSVALIYVGLIVLKIGMRPDMSARVSDPLFVFEIFLALVIFISAGLASSWLRIPDTRGSRAITLTPWIALGIFLLWSAIRSFTQGLHLPAPHWDHCFIDAFLMGCIPAAVLMFTTLRGRTTRPLTMAAMNILSVSALGYIGLRMTCMMDMVGHSLIYHIIPFVVFGTVLGALARRIYRW